MVVLKKILHKKVKSSSLTEVLIATTLILLVFGIAIATLNNTLTNTVRSNTIKIETELNRCLYKYRQQQLKTPLYYEEGNWGIEVTKIKENNIFLVLVEATNKVTKKVITKKLYAHES